MQDISSQVDELRLQMNDRSRRRSSSGRRDRRAVGASEDARPTTAPTLAGAAPPARPPAPARPTTATPTARLRVVTNHGGGGGDTLPQQDDSVLEKLRQLEALLQTEGTEQQWLSVLTAGDYKTVRSLAVHFSSADARVRNAANRILLLAAAKDPTILPHCLTVSWGEAWRTAVTSSHRQPHSVRMGATVHLHDYAQGV